MDEADYADDLAGKLRLAQVRAERAEAREVALREALVEVLRVTPSSDDMRLLLRWTGGVSDSAEKAIARYDPINDAKDKARALLADTEAAGNAVLAEREALRARAAKAERTIGTRTRGPQVPKTLWEMPS